MISHTCTARPCRSNICIYPHLLFDYMYISDLVMCGRRVVTEAAAYKYRIELTF